MKKDFIISLLNSSLRADYIISLYLDVDGKKYPNKEYEIVLKELIKEGKASIERYSEEIKKLINKDLEKIWEQVHNNFARESAKSVAIFCSSKDKIWQFIKLSVPLRSSLIIRDYPYLRPLLATIPLQKMYGIALVSLNQANFYILKDEKIERFYQITNEIPKRVKIAGWQGYAERKVERHIEDHISKHFKSVADKLIEFNNKLGFDHIIIGGEKRSFEEFFLYLPERMQKKIIDKITINIEAESKELLNKIQQSLKNYYADKEKELLEKIKHEALSHGLGAIGLESVFEALRHNQVSSLVVKQNFSLPGKRCPNCHWLHISMDFCQLCGYKMLSTPDLIEDAINLALMQNADVYISSYHPTIISEMEGIAALLRFQI